MKYQVSVSTKTWFTSEEKKTHVTPIHKKITIAMDTLNIINRNFCSKKILKLNGLVFHWCLNNKIEEHYMVNWRYKISLMVLKNIPDLTLHGHVIPSLYIVYKLL